MMKIKGFDNSKAIFEPTNIVKKIDGCPKIVVTCFASNLIDYALSQYKNEVIGFISSANGKIPLYKLYLSQYKRVIGLIMSAVGAPATVCEYEELFAMGVEKIIVFGTCGVLDNTVADCSIIIPDKALREEGTSYHYVDDGDEIDVNVHLKDHMIHFFKSKNIHYTVGKVWTTDAIYRETVNKIQDRKNDGCQCVDMECSAIAALAKFRNKEIAQFFYSADSLDQERYEIRSLANESQLDVKQKIVQLAIELSLELFDTRENNDE